MKEIAVSNSLKTMLVDDEDFDKISALNWCLNTDGRISAAIWKDGKTKHVRPHRLVIECPNGLVIDHRNRDVFDNQKSNLRVCKQGENSKNRVGWKKPKYSKFKGVTWSKRSKVWVAQIAPNRGHKNLGAFATEQAAALAYNIAAIQHFGQFACLNQI